MPSQRHRSPCCQGRTLIDVMATIAIIAMLLQLMFPAIQSAREASRRVQCASNLRQIGIAMSLHQEAKGHFPSGGWHFHWIGEPERGTDTRQPGSWAFNLLEYLGESDLRQMGKGLLGKQRSSALMQRCATPLETFHCPTRRAVQAYPYRENRLPLTRGGRLLEPMISAAKTDYAANVGDASSVEFDWQWPGPQSLPEGDAAKFPWPKLDEFTGVIFGRSRIRPRNVLDGMSKTYLVGEKFINSQRYVSGDDWGDNETLYAGFNNDNCRSTAEPPARDSRADEFMNRFGSAHPQVWQVVFCDGSVHAQDFGLDPSVHRRFGNRVDFRVVRTTRAP